MNTDDTLQAIKDALQREHMEIEKARTEDVIQRTLQKLVKIEKEAMYGGKAANKNTKFERVLREEFAAYKEKVNASSQN